MSMNICVEAISRNELGKQVSEDFDLWQVPSKESYEILNSKDQLQAYVDYINKIKTIDNIDVYAKEDFLNQKDPIGTRQVCYGDEHIEYLKQWIKDKEGFEINWYVM